jgi:oxygen-independent coproporphyrinogen-3 oxidase
VPADYLAEPKAKQQSIATEDRLMEFCMNALRLKEGVEQTLIEQRTGMTMPESVHAKLSQAGLLQSSSSRLVATDLGYRYLDSLLSQLADLAQG